MGVQTNASALVLDFLKTSYYACIDDIFASGLLIFTFLLFS